jgi:P4 family phage/plasmid primase-like protien
VVDAAVRRFDAEEVKRHARGQWGRVLAGLTRFAGDYFASSRLHSECPKCGGKDRFRFSDMNGDGSIICRPECGRTSDGFGTLAWATDRDISRDFGQIVEQVAVFLGVSPSKGEKKTEKKDPAKLLTNVSGLNPLQVGLWCLRKGGIAPEAVAAIGAQQARCLGQNVLAVPSYDESLGVNPPTGWHLYAIGGGQIFARPEKKAPTKAYKVWTTPGSLSGVIADFDRLARARVIWKVEGPSDLMAFLSLPDMPDDAAAFTNANGAGEIPPPWMAGLVEGKTAYVVHDCDEPGQRGAVGYESSAGRWHTGWAEAMAFHATECRNVVLPFPVEPSRGKDLRDWVKEGGTYAKLLELAEAVEPIAAKETKLVPNESPDDPHRLARINLDRFSRLTNGGELRFWRDQWYKWKQSEGCWKHVPESDLNCRVMEAIEEEFSRLNLEEQEQAKSGEAPVKRSARPALVAAVVAAMASMRLVPAAIEPNTWLIDNQTSERRPFLAMKNGILDLDKVLAGKDQPEFLSPHSARWWSTVRLPYEVDETAQCPRWMAFLEKNLEGDPERIAILQEWAGYLLTPDTSLQKFLVLEGEGANGKSVYCAAISAMLGLENCSHVPLEVFGERFQTTATLGKLLNVAADTGEIDKAAEGFLKSFTSGDMVYFDRKGLSGISVLPTARLMLACNNRPRFSDRSTGIWRRMLLVPFRIEISRDERVPGMDKPDWWHAAGELPGIFNWAVQGLARIREQRRFTDSQICAEALTDYQDEVNPTRSFLRDHFEKSTVTAVRADKLMTAYKLWCHENGHHPMNAKSLGKEIFRAFPFVKKERPRSDISRTVLYRGICFSVDEICGTRVSDGQLS